MPALPSPSHSLGDEDIAAPKSFPKQAGFNLEAAFACTTDFTNSTDGRDWN